MLKFFFVVCCFFISLIKRAGSDKRETALLRLGMFFTVLADLMMIIYHYNVEGLIFFCIVQLIYRLRFTDLKRTMTVAAAASLLFIASFLTQIPLEVRLSLFYAVCLISSVVGSFFAYKKRRSRSALMAFIGMALFMMCDINVALYNITSGYGIYRLIETLIWVFYLPSQLFISLSSES